jgi:hypothetical protein
MQAIPMIEVEDLLGNPIRGSLYPQEYYAVPWDGTRTIASIMETRKRNGQLIQKVSFNEFPPSYTEWIDQPAKP